MLGGPCARPRAQGGLRAGGDLGPEHRWLVPFTSFAEFNKEHGYTVRNGAAARPSVCCNSQMTIAMFTMFQPMPLISAAA
jgi:hypothetical protein